MTLVRSLLALATPIFAKGQGYMRNPFSFQKGLTNMNLDFQPEIEQNGNIFLYLRLLRTGLEHISFPAFTHAWVCGALHLTVRKGLNQALAFGCARKGYGRTRHATRLRQIPLVCGGLRSDRRSEARAYPHHVAGGGELCRLRLWAASRAWRNRINPEKRFKRAYASRKLGIGIHQTRIQKRCMHGGQRERSTQWSAATYRQR